MGKTAQKQHEKKKFETGVIGPDGVFYKTGQSGQVELRKVIINGRDAGMFWCHKQKDLRWRKVKHDEIRKEV